MKKFKTGKFNGTYYPIYQLIGGKWVELGGMETKKMAQGYCDYWENQHKAVSSELQERAK